MIAYTLEPVISWKKHVCFNISIKHVDTYDMFKLLALVGQSKMCHNKPRQSQQNYGTKPEPHTFLNSVPRNTKNRVEIGCFRKYKWYTFIKKIDLCVFGFKIKEMNK